MEQNSDVGSMSLPHLIRSSSPSPSVSPIPAISSCPSLVRSFSTVSSLSNSSGTSADGRSTVSISSRRRGYVRPLGVEFAESAKNRESVMCLGSIAHLQYYFARTGLLDGKGGQIARPQRSKAQNEVPKFLLTQDTQFGDCLDESPMEELLDPIEMIEEEDEVMLPPTVSTYSIKTHYIPPPPDLQALRKGLFGALDKASQSVEACVSFPEQQQNSKSPPITISVASKGTCISEDDSHTHIAKPVGWDEIQGMHILDMVTLAIRAARIYYTSHERPDRLAAIKHERKIRKELLFVLDVLKKWASRNFAGGLRADERAAILDWMSGVRAMLGKERQLEILEAEERANWRWADGDWTGREREREESFFQTLMMGIGPPLPTWMPVSNELPAALLTRLRDGRDLVRAHNEAVKKSKRRFGEIETFHEDVAKPYRCMENLQYWLKAAEIRWEMKLEMDVMGVVHDNSDEAWRQFDAALLAWCRGVREELMRDWCDAGGTTPTLPAVPSELGGLNVGVA